MWRVVGIIGLWLKGCGKFKVFVSVMCYVISNDGPIPEPFTAFNLFMSLSVTLLF